MAEHRSALREWLENAAARAVIGAALLLPYRSRLRFMGWFVSRIAGPLMGWSGKARKNIRLAMPELSTEERERVVRQVADNAARALIEIYSGQEFLDRTMSAPRVGPGVAALERAMSSDRPIIFITAHLGNYDVVRGGLAREGRQMAAIYRPMRNKAFNAHYVSAISKIAEPVFPIGTTGMKGVIRHLKSGGSVGILGDVTRSQAPVLSFFGRPTKTPVSAAEWALKYDALLIPVFGLRKPDGVNFEIRVEEPIPPGAPEEMLQVFNDRLEALIRSDPGQWFWIQGRWGRDGAPVAD